MEPPRVAVIGCGRIAQEGHLPAYAAAAAEGRCRLVGVCDIDAERARAVGASVGAPAFVDVDELLSAARPEGRMRIS